MDIRARLEQELAQAIERLRQMGSAAAIDTLGAIGESAPHGDSMDQIQLSVDREVRFATRDLLVGRVNRLAGALERLRAGDYGTCEECGEPIAPARLVALPEVHTCVRCQDRQERLGSRGPVLVGVAIGADEDDDE